MSEDLFQLLAQQGQAQQRYTCRWELVHAVAAEVAAQWPSLLDQLQRLAQGEPARVCPLAFVEAVHLAHEWMMNEAAQGEWPTSCEELLRLDTAVACGIRKFAWSSLLHGVAKRFYRAVLEFGTPQWREGEG